MRFHFLILPCLHHASLIIDYISAPLCLSSYPLSAFPNKVRGQCVGQEVYVTMRTLIKLEDAR